ncbi:hypothetical protein F5I97DRAFT_1925614 [Phlebopus sp. FC_14]|nr:hypothetical protein F5I97DRAFT_1925614 [Phlebopus sp. FC_14]
MHPKNRQTVVLPLNLGLAGSYNRDLFPLVKIKGTVYEGDLLLQATLDELTKIHQMAKHLYSYGKSLDDAKMLYDVLMEKRERLEEQPKSINPIKIYQRQRNLWLLIQGSRKLYASTKKTSERMRRALLSVSSLDVMAVQETTDVSNENVSGIAIDLGGPLDDTTTATISDTATFLSCIDHPLVDADPSNAEHGKAPIGEIMT